MVAKKGEVQAHHFAHQSARDGNSCLSAGETALHKFAKEVLNERLETAEDGIMRGTIQGLTLRNALLFCI